MNPFTISAAPTVLHSHIIWTFEEPGTSTLRFLDHNYRSKNGIGIDSTFCDGGAWMGASLVLALYRRRSLAGILDNWTVRNEHGSRGRYSRCVSTKSSQTTQRLDSLVQQHVYGGMKPWFSFSRSRSLPCRVGVRGIWDGDAAVVSSLSRLRYRSESERNFESYRCRRWWDSET